MSTAWGGPDRHGAPTPRGHDRGMSRDGEIIDELCTLDRQVQQLFRMLPLAWVAYAVLDLAATHWNLAFLHAFIAWLLYAADRSSRQVAEALAGWRQANNLSTRAIDQLHQLHDEL